jgi:hypothetical protein
MTLMRWVWILAWVAAAATAGAMHFGGRNDPVLEGGLRRPVLALELAETVRGADRATALAGGVEGVRKHLRGDRYFLVVYVLLYSLLGGVLARRAGGGWRWLAVAGIACAVATGALDAQENARIADFMGASPSGPDRQPLVDAMRAASLLKWAAFFLTAALLGACLWHAGGPRRPVGGLYLLAAAVGAVGLAGPRAGIEWALTLAFAGAAPSFAAMWTLWRSTHPGPRAVRRSAVPA